MANNIEKNGKKKVDKKKIAVRVVVIILAALMVAGAISMIVSGIMTAADAHVH